MNRSIVFGGLVAAAILAAAGTATAQYRRPHNNPLEDFLGRIGRDNTNQPLECEVVRRLDRDGDIRYLRMECTSRRGVYGR